VASATITIDTGLAGALNAIQTALTSSGGALTASQTALNNKKTSLAAEEDALTQRDTTYRAQLTTQFTNMQTALLAYSSTQSFLTQQIKAWQTSSNN
jgi:flagellar hook-associated protein 2